MLEHARIIAAVEQDILPGHVACLGTAKECTNRAKLFARAEALRGNLAAARLEGFVNALSRCFRGGSHGLLEAIGVELPRKQIVDGHIMRNGLACEAGDEARQSGARAIRQPAP